MKPCPKVKKKKKGDPLDKKIKTIMSLAVRLSDGKCVCCGTTEHLTDGHYIQCRYKGTRYHPLNNHTQCAPCNLKHNYDSAPYASYMVRRYGETIFDQLEALKNEWQDRKYPLEEKHRWLEYWTNELERLQNE